jgi:NADH-quinone oxidoreductase subunit F
MSDLDLTPLIERLTEYAPQGRTALLPALRAAQDTYGYIPESAAAEIGKALNVPLADIYGVIKFYALFYEKPVGKAVVHVCNDPVCSLAGSDNVLKRVIQKYVLQPDGDSMLTVERAPCLGLCEHAPALLVQDTAGTGDQVKTWKDLVSGDAKHPDTRMGGDISILTASCNKGRPSTLEEYEQSQGYSGLRSAVTMTPQEVIAEIKSSGLVGRGGAAFPTGIKWEATANAGGEQRYVVCNADEAEPGTFKDRVMMENDPHRIIEGMIIAAYAVGASKGYIYIRGEYTYPHQVMTQAVTDAQKAGYLGTEILGSSFNYDIELRRGAGAYICGEETALFESIEGKRGLARAKPPFPVTHGLFGKPTAINNVETLCNVPYILSHGAEAYRKIGTEKSPGPKLFCLSGDVSLPGLYEVPLGTTFRRVLCDLAGGIRNNNHMQAALVGGAAGAFATEKDLDVRLSFEHLREAGLPLGAGVITVFDETRDMLDVILRLAHFFAEESCGKCYPCQLGTQRQYEIVQRAATGKALPGDVVRLQEIGRTMTDSSLCGLGQTASSAVLSAVKLWPGLFLPPGS